MTEAIDLEAILESLEKIGFFVRDAGLLASALSRPMTTVFGNEVYPTVHEKAAALVQSVAKYHPMVDGNKRSAWIALNVFLELNDYSLNVPHDEALVFMVAVANDSLELGSISEWVRLRMTPAR